MPRDVQRRDVLKGVGAAGITVALAGCNGNGNGNGTVTDAGNGNGNGNGQGARTLKHGVLLPLSGDLGDLGQPIRDGAILPDAQLSGNISFEIDIQEVDTETNPQAGIQGANNLVNNGYPSLTGPASSGVNLQVTRQSLIPNETVGCSPSSTSPAVTELDDDDYIFRTAPSDGRQGRLVAQVATERLGGSSMATMYVNNSYGQSLSQVSTENFGGEVQTQVGFQKEQSSYSSQLETALADGPDTLVVIGYPDSGVQLFRDYYADFASGEDIIVTDGLIANDLPDDVDNDMANVTGTSPKTSGPGAEAFNQLYNDEYGREPGVFNSQAYDATASCLLANVYAGENDGTAVRDNMRTAANPDGEKFTPDNLAEAFEAAAAGDAINYQGASSACNFDDNGDMGAVEYGIYEVQDTDFVEVDSVEYGT